MSATVGEVMDRAQEVIGEISGPGSQEYGEDRLLGDVVQSFNLLFKKFHWHPYRKWFRMQLDGVTGTVNSTDLEPIKDFEDIFFVGRDAQSRPLPLLPLYRNPYALSSGGLHYWTALHSDHAYYATRKIQFYPVTSVDFVNIGARVYPELVGDTWTRDDRMELDKDLLAFGATFFTLLGDDTNPTQMAAAKELMEMKYKDIMHSISSMPSSSMSGSDIPLGDWRIA